MPRTVYRFDDCTIDPSARELRRRGELATLSPKVFDSLTYLIEHRERAVGRDELIAAVWGKADVSDTLLGQTILKARRAVGDSGNGQNVIRTVPRFGYRWVADIASEEIDGDVAAATAFDAEPEPAVETAPYAQATEAVAASAPPAAAFAGNRRRLAIAGLTLLVAAVAAIAAYVMHQRTLARLNVASKTGGAPIAAVLPVAVSAGEEWSWLRLGLMDLIAARLRRAGQPVIPSDNVVALMRPGSQPNGDSMHAVRDATGAVYIVVPRVTRDADEWIADIEVRSSDGTTRTVHADGSDPIETARAASDRLLALFGKAAPDEAADTGGLSLAELKQRTEAALLSGDFATARHLIDAAPSSLRDTPSMRLRLGEIEFRSGQLSAARSVLEDLLAHTPAESDPVLRARALFTLGAVSLRQDRNDDAKRAFGEAITLASTRNEPSVLGQAYMGIAAAEVNTGEFDAAADNLGRARVAVVLAGDSLALARVDANEGVLDNARGRQAEALPILRRAADRFNQFGALNDLFLTVTAEIKAHLALLDPATALATSDTLWPLRVRLDNPGSRTAFELQRARALAACGRLSDAHALMDQLARETPPQQSGLPGDVASERARELLAAGDASGAIAAARAAVDGLVTIDEARERARAWLTWSRALRASGQDADARVQVDAFSAWAATHAAMPSVLLYSALADAEQSAAERRQDAAYRSYSDALTAAERWAVPADLAAVAISYGGTLIGSSDFERASAVTGRVARWADRDFDCALLQARLYHALGQTTTWRSALDRARALAGERTIPASLLNPPAPARVGSS